MINKIKNRWMAGRGRKLCSALLLAALPLGPAWAANNDMAFTAKIKPWGTSSFDFTILNETLEPITAITVTMDGTDHKFEYLYAGSVTRSARVLEPSYVSGNIGLVREVWNNTPGNLVAHLLGWPFYPNSPNSRNSMSSGAKLP